MPVKLQLNSAMLLRDLCSRLYKEMPGAGSETPRHTFTTLVPVVRHAWTGMCVVVIMAGFSKSQRLYMFPVTSEEWLY